MNIIKGDHDGKLTLNNISWTLSESGTYYETTIRYTAPGFIPKNISEQYQILKLYVPEAYIHSDGSLNKEAVVAGYTVVTAPFILKNNCYGWKSSTPGSVNESWMACGFIQAECGARSRDADRESSIYSKSPCQIVDLKSAIRMLRLNSDLIPGNLDKLISYGFSGGGQMSSMLGASGNMKAYYGMLWNNGSAGIRKLADGTFESTLDDSVYACMCYSPIATLQEASLAHAWMRYDSSMNGSYKFSPFQLRLESDMAVRFCEYINSLELRSNEGEILSFDFDPRSAKPDPRKGSYYRQMLKNLSDALTSFANAGEAVFPYTVCIGMRNNAAFTVYQSFDKLYEKYVEDSRGYVKNGTDSWIREKEDGSWQVSDLSGFFHGTGLTRFKGIPAFDGLYWIKEENCYGDVTGKPTENNAFGRPGTPSVHYSSMIAELMQENYDEYMRLEGFDRNTVDAFISEALDPYLKEQLYLMDSMQIMLNAAKGEEDVTVAPRWRVRMGTADQNSFAIAYNFSMAAQMAGADVNYHLVWAMPHSIDEGSTTGTFIQWVMDII